MGVFENDEVFEYGRVIGEAIFAFFMIMSLVLLLHLLIAMVVHVYNTQVSRVDG